MLKSNFTKQILGLVLACAAQVSFGQNADATSLSGDTNGLGAACATSVSGCDTIGIKRVVSPWRLGGFLGANVAFCGSWANTFPLNEARDRTMFNGLGIAGAFNADYYLTKSDSARFRFGLGGVLGTQHFFMRKGYNEFIDQALKARGLSRADADIHNSTSEDFYFVVGPVVTWAFTKSKRSPYLEAAIRGGIFRTTPASITARELETNNAIYQVTPNYKRYHAGGIASLGVFFPLKNQWALGLQAQGFTTKVSYDMWYVDRGLDVLPRFDRKHGGFGLGVGVRKGFEYDKPYKKAPTPGLSCIAPSLEITANGESVVGKFFNPASTEGKTLGPIVAKWASRTDTAKNETFTARIHHLLNGQDKVIAEKICKEETSIDFPKEYLTPAGYPIEGQYYITVQSQQSAACASCISEVSASGFASKLVEKVVVPDPQPICTKKVEIFAIRKVTAKVKKWAKSANCADCICPVDEVTKTLNKKIVLHKEDVTECDEFKTIESLLAKVAAPKWAQGKDATITVVTTTADPKTKAITTATKSYKAKVNKDGSLTYVGIK